MPSAVQRISQGLQCWTLPSLLALQPLRRQSPWAMKGITVPLHLFYGAGLALVDTTDDLVVPAPKSQETPITGYPEGFWINLVSWSDDSKHIAFTIRSPGGNHFFDMLGQAGSAEALEGWAVQHALLEAQRSALRSNSVCMA